MQVVKSVTVKGFLSYREESTLTLGGKGAVAIVGRNGAGKSSHVSKAISWCLYGKCPPERMGAHTKALAGNDVICDDATDCSVQTVIAEHDAAEWRVTRTRTRKASDKIRIVYATPLGEEDRGTEQETIDNLIGADYDVFTRTCLRGQNDPWSFAEATDNRKREILDVVSGAVRLEVPLERAMQARKKADAEVHALTARQGDMQRRIEAQDARPLAEQQRAWNEDHAKRIAEAVQEVAHLEAAVVSAQEWDAKQEQIRAAWAAHEAKSPVLDLRPYDDAIAKASDQHAVLEAERQVAVAEYQRLINLKPGAPCPTCLQTIVMANTHAHVTEAGDRAGRAAAVAYEWKQHLQQCRDQKAAALAWYEDQLQTWKRAATAMPEAGPPLAPGRVSTLEVARRRLQDIRAAQNPYTAAVSAAADALRELQREASMMEDALVIAREQQASAGAWEQALHPKGVRALLAEGALTAIEAEANRWLAELSDGVLQIEFNPTKEGSTREEIQTVTKWRGGDRKHLALSGGEKRRINLAVDLAVGSVLGRAGGLRLSLLVLDEEQVSGLDAEGKAAALRALHRAGIADVVLIDHDVALTSAMPRAMKCFRRADGTSVLEAM